MGAGISSLPTVGDEIRAPRKTPAWEGGGGQSVSYLCFGTLWLPFDALYGFPRWRTMAVCRHRKLYAKEMRQGLF